MKSKRGLYTQAKISGKRVFDIIFSAISLVILAPLMGVLAVMIWLESPGNVIFSQVRLGLHGRNFRMYKFRKFPAYMKDDGPGLTAKNDARLTKVGKILERTKFDELPQLWNILKGDMTFVGPRPESIKFADLFAGEYADILNYLPGIFGPCQIRFRNECMLYPTEQDMELFYRRELFPQKAECDLSYFRKANHFNDLVIILRGIWITVAGIFNWRSLLIIDFKLMAFDLVLIGMAWLTGNFLHFSGWLAAWDSGNLLKGFILAPPLLVLALLLGGIYRILLKYFSLYDLGRLLLTITFACFLFFLLFLVLKINISLYLVNTIFFILIAILPLPRIFYHFWWRIFLHQKYSSSKRIIIYGADQVGFEFATWIGNGNLVGFLDDNPELKGQKVGGFCILGHENDIPIVHHRYHFDQIWLAFKPGQDKLSRLKKVCGQRRIDLFVLPDIKPFDILNGQQIDIINRQQI